MLSFLAQTKEEWCEQLKKIQRQQGNESSARITPYQIYTKEIGNRTSKDRDYYKRNRNEINYQLHYHLKIIYDVKRNEALSGKE